VSDSGPDPIDVLRSLLDVAQDMVRRLQNDPLFARLMDVFTRMPAMDRETVVGVLEREVRTRLLAEEVADSWTQVALHPNPHARLYVRVIAQEDRSDDVEMLAFLRAAYSVQRGIDTLDPEWRRMVLLALRQMDPAARQKIDGFNRAMRALLDAAAADEPASAAPTPPADVSAPADGPPSAARK
jgi:hypothetical protein